MDQKTLLYLIDEDLTSAQTEVVSASADATGNYLVLRETPFYPQGGGQPSDIGMLTGADGACKICQVSIIEDEVRHYYSEETLPFSIGETVTAKIDKDVRKVNCLVHSAGHLVSHVVETLLPSLIPIKGYHHKEGAYVEFLDESRVGSAEMVEDFQKRLDHDIEADLPINVIGISFTQVHNERPALAEFIPQSEIVRAVQIGSYAPLPCGGTHTRSTKELGNVAVRRFKRRKNVMRLSYILPSAKMKSPE